MNVKPIETHYNGYRFRSRLEARWAVFFDAAGIKYQYEPEGFEVGEFEEPIRYLPDFYLTDLGIYVEVKPNIEKLKEESERLAWMIDYAGPCANGILILGQIPNVDLWHEPNIPVFLFCHHGRAWIESMFATFARGNLLLDEWSGLSPTSAPELVDFGSRPFDKEFDELYMKYHCFVMRAEQNRNIPCNLMYWECIPYEAYEKARQARFEHGETPRAERVEEIFGIC